MPNSAFFAMHKFDCFFLLQLHKYILSMQMSKEVIFKAVDKFGGLEKELSMPMNC